MLAYNLPRPRLYYRQGLIQNFFLGGGGRSRPCVCTCIARLGRGSHSKVVFEHAQCV